ncbi:MAG: SlyX family protein [Chromatiales bacterium]|nr:MAG: SlyX family protein [Chromatiales bacterium]
MKEDRLTEIEIKVAHLEQSLNELNDVLVRQQSYIDALERGFERLVDRLQAGNETQTDSDPAVDKPPHY